MSDNNDPFDNSNPWKPGTAEHFTYGMAAQAQQRQAAQEPIQVPKGLGEWVAALGCCFFLFGVLWSMTAVTLIGHVILIVGTTLLGMAIAVAGYAVLKGPSFLIALIGWAWRDKLLSRSGPTRPQVQDAAQRRGRRSISYGVAVIPP